jgi:hypothetical protein
MDEFRASIPLELRQATDPTQVKEFNEDVFEVLARIG